MDYYRPTAMKELLGDVDRVMTMDEIVSNVSPSVNKHTVVNGDTLWDIAERHGTTVREIIRLNPHIKNPNVIKAGEVIDVPDSRLGTSESSDRDYMGAEQDALGMLRQPSSEDDALGSSHPELLAPLLKPLGALAGNGLTKGIAALAGAAPRGTMAGQIGQRFKGAVPHAGATPAMSNVRPAEGVGPGAVKAMLAKMQGQRPLGQGGQMPPLPQIPPFTGRGPNQVLGRGARIPLMGKGTETPPQNTSLLDALRQGSQKMNAGGNEAIIQQMIQKTGGQPTLGQLQTAGRGNLQGAGGNQSFQELLRRVGYGR